MTGSRIENNIALLQKSRYSSIYMQQEVFVRTERPVISFRERRFT
jgi:hypothetical protein